MDGHLCTFSHELRVIWCEKLFQILFILGLTGNCSESLVPDNVLFIIIFDALSHIVLTSFDSNLSQNETSLMLKQ